MKQSWFLVLHPKGFFMVTFCFPLKLGFIYLQKSEE